MKRFICLIAALAAISASLFAVVPAYAQAGGSGDILPGCKNGQSSGSAICASHNNTAGDPLTGSGGILTKATQLIALMGGIASVIMIIVGGFRYVLSNGDASAAASARRTIIYAAIGLVIIASAGSIIAFALSRI